MTFDPTSVEVTCATLPKDHWRQPPWNYIKVCGYSDHFSKTLTIRLFTPRWPSTLLLLRSHVRLYPRILVSKSHGNTSMYVDTVTIFQKFTEKVNDPKRPLDDLWSHICRGHMFQLYPRIIGVNSHGNTSKYMDTVIIFQNFNQKINYP